MNMIEILSKNGYSKAEIKFFEDSTFPISSKTLNLAIQKKVFFDIYMSYAQDVALYISKHPGLFTVREEVNEIVNIYKQRYEKYFLSEDGSFIYPSKNENVRNHQFWITGNNIELDY